MTDMTDGPTVYRDSDSILRRATLLLMTKDSDVEELKELGRLLSLYLKAKANPPEGVIGVGAITYAEQQLVQAQA